MKTRAVPLATIHQILDANANRAREGFRVVEEVFRFVRKDAGITRRLKAMRREVVRILAESRIAPSDLLESRNSWKDPGRVIHGESEMQRASVQDILNANLHRVGEALRVLEEFSKLLDAKAALQYKQLRFRFYDLEKAVCKVVA